MTVDPTVVPGLLLLAGELFALAAVGYVVVRVVLRQADERAALAQGLVVGLALWGLVVNFVLYAVPGLAGALVGWIVVLAAGAGLAWRARGSIAPRPRVAAGFAVAVLALLWVVLASRQLLTFPDPHIHLGLSTSIRAGGYPPVLPWSPDLRAPYHYGEDLLRALLMPPVGPDLAFMEELLSAYYKVGLLLVVVTALLRRASRFAVLITAPLLLTTGTWTLVIGVPDSIFYAPFPTGLPAAGLRASLMDIYWPAVDLDWNSPFAGLSDVLDPSFLPAYALTFVVLEHAAGAGRRSWPAVLTLAALVGFMGLLASTLAPMVLVLWAGLEAVALAKSKRAGSLAKAAVIRSAAGLALAALVLFAGGRLVGILEGSAPSGLSLGWYENFGGWRLLGTLDPLPGGVGVLGLGAVTVAGAAALLAHRDRLVLALVIGAGALVVMSAPWSYEPFQIDLSRIEGHARNLALLAFVLALSTWLSGLPSVRWRYAAGALFVALIAWPTLVAPVRNLGLAIGQGVEFANARRAPEPQKWFAGRYPLDLLPAEGISVYIRDNTAVDARVFSPRPHRVTWATGRPNATGFAGLLHLFPVEGPSYLDVLRYLEPAAVRRLGFGYVHAPDEWVAGLPAQAARWLDDPRLFELLVRDGDEALYRVRPAFLELNAAPDPRSFEALRQAVPASTAVYISPEFDERPGLRVAWALSHTQLFSSINPAALHLLTPWPGQPLGGEAPDLVIMSSRVKPWMFPPARRQPIWWNDEIAVYAPDGAVAPIMPPPPESEPPPVSVRLSDVRAADGRVTFTATFDDDAPELWTGQEWIVTAGDASPWGIPQRFEPDGRTVATVWFPGQVAPGRGTTSHTYVFDILAPSLSVQDASGALSTVAESERVLGAGTWTLAVRLQHEWQPNYWREAAFIPVMRLQVSVAGEVSYAVFDDVLGGVHP